MIQASFFAREGIELMYNLRDSNYVRSLPRNCIFMEEGRIDGKQTNCTSNSDTELSGIEQFCDGCFTSGTALKISIGSGRDHIHAEVEKLSDDFATNFSGFRLYRSLEEDGESFRYTHTGTEADALPYARYILIKPLKDGNDDLPTENIVKIESYVLYQKVGLT